MNENLADLLWSLVPVLALWLIYAVVAIMRAPLQVLNAAVGAVEAERKGQQTRADDAERKIAATAAVEAEKPSVYVEFIEDKSTEAKRVDRIRVTNTSSKLLILALLAGCSDADAPSLRVRTEGARDQSQPWVLVEERIKPNGDLWTRYEMSHMNWTEERWDHRSGMSTRAVPKDERIP